MCGIAGIISREPEGYIPAMLRSIEHRGRDDEGTWTSRVIDSSGRQVALGHRRLAIIDPSSAGHQPMISDNGRYIITFNGEIYNYRELRKRLEAKQHRFKTATDTEVLLAAFKEWGDGCLTHLNGMFAFAVWDDQERTLTLARDHVGIKPLYYTHVPPQMGQPGIFLFASEVKAILATGLIERALDPEGLHQFLTFLWVPDPNTLFRNIKTVPPAQVLTFHSEKTKSREWWDVSFADVDDGKPEEWWQEQVLETLNRVVGMEMVSDVPLGSFLSGGIDSSAIVALMKNHSNGRRISTYTAGIKAEDLRYDIIPNDVRWARLANQHLDTDYHEITLQPSVAGLLPHLVYHLDEPAVDMAISSYLIAQAAREKLTVMLSGMGGDELFAGYPRQLAMKLAAAIDPVPSVLKRPLLRTVESVLPGGMAGPLTAPFRNAKKFARSAGLDFESRYLGYGSYFTDEAKKRLYTAEMAAVTKEVDAYSMHRTYFARAREATPLNQLLYVDLKTFLPCLNLMTTDKTSMAANLEVRVPFLNRELIELAGRMPSDLKLRGFKRKYILKKALNGILPNKLIWRKKAGFGAPIRSWLRGPLRPLVEDMLSEETIKRRGLFQPEVVRRIIDANLSGKEDFSLMVFQLLNLELWQRTFLD